jgi:hypothetical protein
LAAPKLGPLKNTISTLQRRILDVGGPKLARIQAKIEILSKQYDAQFDQLNTKQNELANLNKMVCHDHFFVNQTPLIIFLTYIKDLKDCNFT